MTFRTALLVLLTPVVQCAGLPIAAQDASASSTFSPGNLVGSPEFAPQNALSSGSGYWCSAGSHSPGESITWTATLGAARSLSGLQIQWAHAPGSVRVLTSPDGANFEEARCWTPTALDADSGTETLLFDKSHKAKVISIVMRGPRASGYIAISQVELAAEPSEPTMIVAGVTAGQEQCITVENGSVDQVGALLTAEPCAEAIAAGDGRELFALTEAGQLKTVAGANSLCALLAGNNAAGGGEVELGDCDAAAESGDARSFWAFSAGGQLTMGGGSYCMVVAGGAGFGADVAPTAAVSATASADGSDASKLTDGGSTAWQSPAGVAGPVSLSFVLPGAARVSSISIDWKADGAAMDFEVQTAREGGAWTTFGSVVGNTLEQSTVRGASVVASRVRIILTAPLGEAYAATAVRIITAPLKMQVQDCAEAGTHGDARDFFFPEASSEFDPQSSSAVRATAPLLEGAIRQLGKAQAEFAQLKPKLEACKAKLSLASGISFLSLTEAMTEAPHYAQVHRKSVDGRLCASAAAQDEQTFSGCSTLATPAGDVGKPWCYLAPQLIDAASDAQNWQYCAGLVDYEALRAAVLPDFAAAQQEVRSSKARINLAERAVERTLATVQKICG